MTGGAAPGSADEQVPRPGPATTRGRALAAPSASRSGRVSPTRAEDVAEELGERVALILDGGPCQIGIESTVLLLTGAATALWLHHGSRAPRMPAR